MTRYLTLKKDDPSFQSYIWGTFSESHRALPVESLNTGTSIESVTFEIKDKGLVQAPSLVSIFFRLVKWDYFFLLLVPIFYVFVKNNVYQRFFDPTSFLLACASSAFLFAGVNVRNDVLDHVMGFDRIIKSSHPKPILKGWITAQAANHLAWSLLFLSVVIATPVLIKQVEALRVTLVVIVLFLTGNFVVNNSYKHKYFAEFILFIILGPALCAGYQVALGSGVDTEILFFGVMWGVAVLFLLYIVQFANIFETSQAQVKNTLTKMGFDKSKTFLKFWWIGFIVLWVSYHYFYASLFWTWFGTLALLFWSAQIFIKLSHVFSPMGSDLSRVRQAGYGIFALMVVLLVLEQSWYLYTHLNWVL